MRAEYIALTCVGVLLLAFDIYPTFKMEYDDRRVLYQEHNAFHTSERELLTKYPRVLGRVFEDSMKYTNQGRFIPVLRHVWHHAETFAAPRHLLWRLFTGWIVRIITPQSLGEYIGLCVMIGLLSIGLVGAAYFYFNSVNTRMIFDGIFKNIGLTHVQPTPGSRAEEYMARKKAKEMKKEKKRALHSEHTAADGADADSDGEVSAH